MTNMKHLICVTFLSNFWNFDSLKLYFSWLGIIKTLFITEILQMLECLYSQNNGKVSTNIEFAIGTDEGAYTRSTYCFSDENDQEVTSGR